MTTEQKLRELVQSWRKSVDVGMLGDDPAPLPCLAFGMWASSLRQCADDLEELLDEKEEEQ